MELNELDTSNPVQDEEDTEADIDPIKDIIDYLVRCVKISFKNAHKDEAELRTTEKIKIACDLFNKSPTDFLIQFGKYLTPHHLKYFENLKVLINNHGQNYEECLKQLQIYHSEESKRKRIRNRRYKALQKLLDESDYFSDTQMMSRNPLLYEQLVGQYLTDDEIKERDGVDRENLTFLNLILETVDRNQIRETKNEQMLAENLDMVNLNDKQTTENNGSLKTSNQWGELTDNNAKKRWGDFEKVDTRPSHKPEVRKQCTISAPERQLLREEFLQEMYSSYIEGRDDVDYDTIDNNEQYDDLQMLSQDAEDKYFDSETNEVENLEEHMKLVEEYGKKPSVDSTGEDPLDAFMTHISSRLK